MAETTQEILKVYVRILMLYCALFFPPLIERTLSSVIDELESVLTSIIGLDFPSGNDMWLNLRNTRCSYSYPSSNCGTEGPLLSRIAHHSM